MKASMGSFLIVEAQPGLQRIATLRRISVRYGVGPFAEKRLDHSLRFAVSLRAKGTRSISPAVIGDHTLDLDAAPTEFAQRTQPECRRGVAVLIRQDLDVAKARMIIDGDMRVLPADTAGGITAIASDALTRPCNSAQLLDVHMHQLAGTAPFVALYRRRRIEVAQPTQSQPTQHRAHRRARHRHARRDLSCHQLRVT